MEQERSVLAVDLGGTNMRAALVARSGAVVARAALPTLAASGGELAMGRLARLLRKLASPRRVRPPEALGLALAGPVDPQAGTLHQPPNLPGWDGFSPQESLSRSLGLPAFSHNDVTLAALGEHSYGVARSAQHLLFIAWGTGIGGGLVINGTLYDGHRGYAGEVGHMVLDPGGPLCACGKRGCLEAFTCGPAMARRARERLEAGEPSLVRRLVRGDLGRIRAETLARADGLGDRMARSVLTEAAEAMGRGLASVAHLLDPELVVIGGGVSQMLHALYPALVRSARDHSMDGTFCPVVSTALGDDAGLLGAAVLAWRRLGG